MKTSEHLNELAAALAKAQGLIRNAAKDSDNPFFKSKYADLASVWDACRAELSANGLAVTQVPEMDEHGKVRVHTLLMHSSGQWVCGDLQMSPVKSDPQGIGSCLTYIRRYALSAIVGIAPEDDDGNAASGKQAAEKPQTTNKSKQSTTIGAPPLQEAKPNGDVAYITDAQRKRFFAITRNSKWEDEEVKSLLKDHGVFSTSHITKNDYEKLCAIIETKTYAEYCDYKSNPPAA